MTTIPARVRIFSDDTIKQITGLSRTTRWRRKQCGKLGLDVVRYVQADRAEAGLPALSEAEEADILAALVAVEDACNAKGQAASAKSIKLFAAEQVG